MPSLPSPRPSPFRHLGRWTAELILVFVGVYGAFWLNNYQQRREDARRHDQILAELEIEATEAIQNMKDERVHEARDLAEFHRALAAGEMPTLHTFSFTTDYNPSDVATLLESGGYQLLRIQTLVDLRNVESVLRDGVNNISHIETLSDQLIAPNLDEDITFFYDPATKKLRKRFAKYPDWLESVLQFLDDFGAAETKLLADLKAERARP